MNKNVLAAFVLICSLKCLRTQTIVVTTCRSGPSTLSPLFPNATVCENELDTATCNSIFPPNRFASPVDFRRPTKCDDINLYSTVLQCAKHCYACCLTSAVTCGNNPASPINCEANANKCKNPAWAFIMNEYCPSTCGTCLTGRCNDTITSCEDLKSLCNTVGVSGEYVRSNCRRSCQLCSNSALSTTTPSTSICSDVATNCAANIDLCNNSTLNNLMTQKCARTCNRCSLSNNAVVSTCADNHQNCNIWVQNGFCNNTFYTTEQKRQYCGISCNLCSITNTTCTDSHQNCAIWVQNGFCNNTFYTVEQRRQYCGISCNLCPTTISLTSNTSCTDASQNCYGWVQNGFCNNNFYTTEQKRYYCGRSCNLC